MHETLQERAQLARRGAGPPARRSAPQTHCALATLTLADARRNHPARRVALVLPHGLGDLSIHRVNSLNVIDLTVYEWWL